jgi:drug/metabolite transporter (DMT)-like permease
MAMSNRDRLELLLLATIWGASFLFMRIATPEFGPVLVATIRIAVAAMFLFAVLAIRGGVRELWEHKGALVVVGAVSSALPFTLFAYATLSVTAGTAAVLNATAPLFAALVAYIWLRDRLTRAQVLGLAVGFAGVVVLMWDEIAVDGDRRAALAVLAGLIASVSYGVAVNYTKTHLQTLDPFVTAAGSQITSTLLLLPFVPLQAPSAPSPIAWAAVLTLGVLCTGIAYILYFRLIARIGPARAITVTYLVPVFGMLWGLVFLGEAITPAMFIACGVILLGTALATGNLRLAGRREATLLDRESHR